MRKFVILNYGFYKLNRDCIIPILGYFIAGTMKIGKKIPKDIYQLFPLIKNSYINYINKVIIILIKQYVINYVNNTINIVQLKCVNKL